MIKFVEKVHRYSKRHDFGSDSKFEVFKIYPNSYSFNDLIKSNVQEKK